jgi:hypothetical protein
MADSNGNVGSRKQIVFAYLRVRIKINTEPTIEARIKSFARQVSLTLARESYEVQPGGFDSVLEYDDG